MAWLPDTSVVVAPARSAIVRRNGGGIIRSSVVTRYQLGFPRHAGSLTIPLSASTPQGTCESAMKAASRAGTSPGLTLFAGGLVWFAQLPVHGSYLQDILGPSLLIALGLGMAFVPITILSVTGVKDREYGLASGLVNTSQQIGGALGLAVLSTIAMSRTNHLAAAHHPIDQALTLGFHTAFLGAGGFVLIAIIAAASIGSRRAKPNETPTATAPAYRYTHLGTNSPGAQPASGAYTYPRLAKTAPCRARLGSQRRA